MIIAPPSRAGKPLAEPSDIDAPLAGLIANKPPNRLGPMDALVLDNWVCRTDGLTVRDGYTLAATGHGNISHLMAKGSSIYSVSGTQIRPLTGIGAGIVLPATTQEMIWGSAAFANQAGAWLMVTDGVHVPHVTNGVAWNPCTITLDPDPIDGSGLGVVLDPTKLCGPIWAHNRLWFYERGSLILWYLKPQAFEGNACPVYAEGLAKHEGEIVCIGVMDGDAGKNDDDAIVAVTSKGEILVYAGSDPDVAGSWSLQGVWKGPKPVGRRCLAQVGGDLVYLCADGLLSIQGIIGKPRSKQLSDGVTEPIRPLIEKAIAAAPNDPAWQVLDSIGTGLLIINAPGGVQYVLASETGGWSRFRSLSAGHWLEADDRLYFGTADGVVGQYNGYADNGNPIQSLMITGWSRLKGQGRKVMHRAQPYLETTLPYRPRIEVLTDYQTLADTYPANDLASSFWSWPEAYEGTTGASTFRPVSRRLGQWRGLSGHADDAVALLFAAKSTSPLKFYGARLMIEGGRIV